MPGGMYYWNELWTFTSKRPFVKAGEHSVLSSDRQERPGSAAHRRDALSSHRADPEARSWSPLARLIRGGDFSRAWRGKLPVQEYHLQSRGAQRHECSND